MLVVAWALRIELGGVGELAGVLVGGGQRHEYPIPSLERMPIDFDIVGEGAGAHGNRIEAHHLIDDFWNAGGILAYPSPQVGVSGQMSEHMTELRNNCIEPSRQKDQAGGQQVLIFDGR